MGVFGFCGPKLSACCMVISAWGIIQLALMGGAFYVYSPNLIEDIGINETEWELTADPWRYVADKYEQSAYNCWVAAGFYVITLILSSITCYLNSRQVY